MGVSLGKTSQIAILILGITKVCIPRPSLVLQDILCFESNIIYDKLNQILISQIFPLFSPGLLQAEDRGKWKSFLEQASSPTSHNIFKCSNILQMYYLYPVAQNYQGTNIWLIMWQRDLDKWIDSLTKLLAISDWAIIANFQHKATTTNVLFC